MVLHIFWISNILWIFYYIPWIFKFFLWKHLLSGTELFFFCYKDYFVPFQMRYCIAYCCKYLWRKNCVSDTVACVAGGFVGVWVSEPRKRASKPQEEWEGENWETACWNSIGFWVLSAHQPTENSHWLRKFICQLAVLVTSRETHKGR